MQGAFGRLDWLANGTLFGLYNVHQPWGIPGGVVVGALLFAVPAKESFHAWITIIVHSGQGLFFDLLALPLILGWA